MRSLIINEHMKIIYKKSNKVLFGGLLVLSITLSLITKRMVDGAGVNENIISYLSFTTGFLSILPFFAIAIASGIVANEFDWGTIKFLLIRPAKRSKVLLSKYVTVLLVSLYLFFVFFVSSMLLGALLFGFEYIKDDAALIKSTLIGYGLSYVETIVATTFAFSISTVFRNSSLAVGLSVLLTLAGEGFVQLLSTLKVSWGKYLLYANTDFGQYIGGSEPLFEGMTASFSIFVTAVYMVLFLVASWWTFTKRDMTV
ncbi:ABC transporter permease [Bacillus sp. CGMCC 1.16541]|uniref:ABC transporter permease n=1 Tax=Bacillus sp. CGMCC 1.16541 TaxID=2185143 RepID=UPI000D727BB4|nr:ABC transporter permease [Bacillus sp. CGMCC 1.16541]